MTPRPRRIQRKRTKGWRMPDGAIYVGRPTKWGNPFRVESDWLLWTGVALGFKGDKLSRHRAAVHLYRAWLTQAPVETLERASDAPFGGAIEFGDGRIVESHEYVAGMGAFMSEHLPMPALPARPSLDELRGRDLACWCPLDAPCHADVLVEIANA